MSILANALASYTRDFQHHDMIFRRVRVLTREGNLAVKLAGVPGTIGALVVMPIVSGLLFFQTSAYPIYLVGLFWVLAMGVFHFCMFVLSIQIPGEGT